MGVSEREHAGSLRGVLCGVLKGLRSGVGRSYGLVVPRRSGLAVDVDPGVHLLVVYFAGFTYWE